MRAPPVPKLVLYALAITLGIGLVVAASTSSAAFGAYNVEWDGTSDFRELADTHGESQVSVDTAAYETVDPNATVAVVLAPADSYDGTEATRVREFVDAGGTLVVADNFGSHGNTLLAETGATARFNGSVLRDEQHYYRAPSLPIATNVTQTPYTVDVEQLTLNRGTAVDSNNATTIATTSGFAYLDREGTGTLSDGDELAEYSVVTVESVGDGTVVTVGDPSLFINTMLSQPDNAAFATALVETREHVLLDYSHADDQPPLALALMLLRSAPLLQIAIGIGGLGIVWGSVRSSQSVRRTVRDGIVSVVPIDYLRRLPVWLRGSATQSAAPLVDEEAVFASLREQYPDLDETRLRRVIADVLSSQLQSDDDE